MAVVVGHLHTDSIGVRTAASHCMKLQKIERCVRACVCARACARARMRACDGMCLLAWMPACMRACVQPCVCADGIGMSASPMA